MELGQGDQVSWLTTRYFRGEKQLHKVYGTVIAVSESKKFAQIQRNSGKSGWVWRRISNLTKIHPNGFQEKVQRKSGKLLSKKYVCQYCGNRRWSGYWFNHEKDGWVPICSGEISRLRQKFPHLTEWEDLRKYFKQGDD